MKKAKHYLVTGGTGFIGAALVRRLVESGHSVRVLDNQLRGSNSRLEGLLEHVELIEGDIRNPDTVKQAVAQVDAVCHLAFVNGTEYFYEMPELVLDVGVKGIVNVIDACIAQGVGELIVASSSEVYQQPDIVPTPETVPLVIDDPSNPRYSYSTGKILSEVMALNYGRKHFEKVLIFRPHNVYGSNMGWEHVIPQFVLRMKELCEQSPGKECIRFPIQGDGKQTRAFNYIDDFIDGLMLVMQKGDHLGTYHIGTTEEVTIAHVAELIADCFEREIEIVAGVAPKGGTLRRCPDISKLAALGYKPRVPIAQGLPIVARWYADNAHQKSKLPTSSARR